MKKIIAFGDNLFVIFSSRPQALRIFGEPGIHIMHVMYKQLGYK